MKIGVSIILHGKGKILMQHRDNKETIAYPNYWGLFGGHVEEGEDPEYAIVREVEEELGMKIRSPKLLLSFENEGDEEFVFAYNIDYDTSNLKLNEGQGVDFLSLEDLSRKRVVPWHLPVLKDFLQKYTHET